MKGHEYKEAYSNPRNLQIKLEDEETKKFPIVPKTTGTVRDGYVLGSVTAVRNKCLSVDQNPLLRLSAK